MWMPFPEGLEVFPDVTPFGDLTPAANGLVLGLLRTRKNGENAIECRWLQTIFW